MELRRVAAALTLGLSLASCSAHSSTAAPPGGSLDAGPVAREGQAADAWWNGAVFYEVFVRSFQDSNGDGIGDLNGLVARLDYLNDGDPATHDDLGVDALWLMPVFDSPSYHGYDTVDYERIEPDYGTNADFQRLLDEAHRRGIRVIVDFVVNHTGVDHPWFRDSASSPSSAKRDWYVWRSQDPGWVQPWGSNSTWHQRGSGWYYGVFWGGMPDLNYATPAVRDEMKRIATRWLDAGVDGFRLDAIRYVIETGRGSGQADTPETLAFLKELHAHVRGVKPDAVMVGEAWTDTPIIAKYYGSTAALPGGDVLPLTFDFPLAQEILWGLQAGDGAALGAKLVQVRDTYPQGAADAPFLTNHDQRRIASELGGDASLLRSAASILLTLPGSPFLYYGEEIGLRNGSGNEDEWKRTPMPWSGTSGGRGFTTAAEGWFEFAPGSASVEAQRADPASLLSRYRTFIGLRKGSAALRRGELRVLSPLSGTSPTLAFLRTAADERVVVVHNLEDGPRSVSLQVEATAAEPMFVDEGATLVSEGATWKATIPAHGSGVWRVR